MDIIFTSLEELYQRIKPALTAKSAEMHRNGFNYIKEEDIWNYLKEIKWRSSKDLSLSDMVSDILNTEDMIIDGYLKTKLNATDRKVYFDNDK